jgi:hypothetical protein
MTTEADPRIAALAEALPARLFVALMPEDRDDERRETAADILAALPPDWCGHSQRDREDEAWFMDAEIARLRARMNDRISIWQAIPWFVLGWICAEIIRMVLR